MYPGGFNPFAKKEEVYASNHYYKGMGKYMVDKEKPMLALKYFDDAVKYNPEDPEVYFQRARWRGKVGWSERAMQDIDHALSMDPDNLKYLGEKTLQEYLDGEFEDGLILNTRNAPKRKKPEVFSSGIAQCTEAIQNTIGARAGHPLRDHFKIIRKTAYVRNHKIINPRPPSPVTHKEVRFFKSILSRKEATDPVVPKKHALRRSMEDGDTIKDELFVPKKKKIAMPPFDPTFAFRPLQNYTGNIENYMAEKYLDVMALDKMFLKSMAGHPGILSPNEKNSHKLQTIANKCYKDVWDKQEKLRSRRPFYFIRYKEGRLTGTLQERIAWKLKLQQATIKKIADKIMGRMLEAHEQKQLKAVLLQAEKLKKYCRTHEQKVFPSREHYLRETFHVVCDAYYNLHRLDKDQTVYDQNKRINALLGMLISQNPSKDSVIKDTLEDFLNYAWKIEKLEKELKGAVVSEEICWLYYELGRMQLVMKQYNVSRLYAKNLIQEAKSIGNYKWIFTGSILLTKISLKQENKMDTEANLDMALQAAKALGDHEKIYFVNQCMEVVGDIEFDTDSGSGAIHNRERRIIKMMSTAKMKEEVSFMFRTINSQPESRRMSVIPGLMVKAKKQKEKGKGDTDSHATSTTSSKISKSFHSLGLLKEALSKPANRTLLDLLENL